MPIPDKVLVSGFELNALHYHIEKQKEQIEALEKERDELKAKLGETSASDGDGCTKLRHREIESE
jgi:SMC interacting uncharacterized protein involved in chromosome segregation